MCFNNTEQKEAKIAENDIECYKFLSNYGGGLKSPFNIHPAWEEKVVNEVKDFIKETIPYSNLNIGFHSCKTIDDSISYRADNAEEDCAIYKFIIPKGSLYFENSTQYLSNKIYLASKEEVEEADFYEGVSLGESVEEEPF